MTDQNWGPPANWAPPASASPQAAPPIQRPGAGRFLPKAEAPRDSGIVVQRNVLQPSRGDKKLTSRQRRIAGNLPDWEPLPPNELLVRRGV
ncbi:MAG TPA: hypothetical protein PKA68_01245 [Arachnia sp.]|nr:hypothetical protein [Arachnia sp.]